MAPSQQRLLARAAGRICAALRTPPMEAGELPRAAWDRCDRSRRLLDHARARGWAAAERGCRTQLRRSLADLRRQLEALDCELTEDSAPRAQTLSEVYEDLVAIDSEFAGVRINLQEAVISVVTGPITLSGVDLGRFEIALQWRLINSGRAAYTVCAVDGGGALSDSAVSHPHVHDEQLCEGDGAAAIRAALRSGRLLDFLTIVAQTLATYNPQSAYRTLDDWLGVTCTDCGSVVDSEETSCCERCNQDLCDDCQCSCAACGRVACSECGAACSHCGQHHCRECLVACADCGNQFCERSLNEERCEDCRAATAAADQAEPEAGDHPALSGQAHASDHSLRVGEATLPA